MIIWVKKSGDEMPGTQAFIEPPQVKPEPAVHV